MVDIFSNNTIVVVSNYVDQGRGLILRIVFKYKYFEELEYKIPIIRYSI